LIADLSEREVLIFRFIDAGSDGLRELATHGADLHATGLDGPINNRSVEADKLVDILVLPVQVEEVKFRTGRGIKEASIERCAESSVVGW